MNLEELSNGKILATDDKGISHIFNTIEEAQAYLWDKDNSKKTVEKYKDDVKKAYFDLEQDPIYFEWLYLLEKGSPEEIDDFLKMYPAFASEYLSAYFDTPENREASYETVKKKGMDFIWNDDIYVNIANTNRISGIVDGWTGIYHTYVSKSAHLTKDNNPSSGLWFCDCPWGTWCNSGHRPHDGPNSTGSVKIQNRFCSHAYAMYKLLHDRELLDLYLTTDTGAVLV